ncbi:putative E3 ubiquitin-protein ligase LOG2 [Wolffia australiana]
MGNIGSSGGARRSSAGRQGVSQGPRLSTTGSPSPPAIFPPRHPPAFPLVKCQKAAAIRSDVNLKKETQRLEPDEENPGCFLVAFTFDATAPGRMSVAFFAREEAEGRLAATAAAPFTAAFEGGMGQRFRQPPGSGIRAAALAEALAGGGRAAVGHPLAVSAESQRRRSALVTLAALEPERGGGWRPTAAKQILWAGGKRYELHEIYGIGHSPDDPAKDCVICLSEARDTAVLPCRDLCMCGGCAQFLGMRSNRCPICRQPIERLLEIRVNGDHNQSQRPDEG